jgi:hypothetical protein
MLIATSNKQQATVKSTDFLTSRFFIKQNNGTRASWFCSDYTKHEFL